MKATAAVNQHQALLWNASVSNQVRTLNQLSGLWNSWDGFGVAKMKE